MQTAIIRASEHWNRTAITLQKGRAYRFRVRGEWTDCSIGSDARGYSRWYLRLFEPLRRVPEAQWFALIGAYDLKPSTCFDIGRLIADHTGRYVASHSGGLTCFANDLPFMYWNNKGVIELDVFDADEADS
jgi:hypothetical protein